MPDAGVLATILLIVGLFLLALELMVPSFGMLGILSAITLLISAWCAWQAWWGTSPGFFWTYAAFWLLGIPSVVGGALFLLQNTRLGDRLVLRGPGTTSEDQTTSDHPLSALVGQTGVSASLLTPGGMVRVGNERHHAESSGMVIDANCPIEVIGIKGNRLVVKLADTDSVADAQDAQPNPPEVNKHSKLADTVTAADLTESSLASADESAGILDFDIPED